MVTMQSWMFLSSFEKMRERICGERPSVRWLTSGQGHLEASLVRLFRQFRPLCKTVRRKNTGQRFLDCLAGSRARREKRF